jgi:hypothetical protein
MYSVNAEIEGVEPGLLMHKFGDAAQADSEKLTKKSGGHAPSAKDEAEAGAYRLENGELCQPAEHIYQAMCKAASDFQVKGKGKKTYKGVVTGNVVIAPEFISHGRKDYEIDSRPVRIQRARIIRRRPFLQKWSLSFEIKVLDEDLLPKEVLNAVLVKAGESVGIGDYRPRFGRFIVTKFE